MLPRSVSLKTRMGILLSRQSVTAVESMTPMRSARKRSYVSRANIVRVGVARRVAVVDALDLGGLEERLGVDLHRAQGRGGVGREVRVAGAGGEDDDAPLLEVAHRAPADVGLGDLADLDGRHARASGRRAFSSASCSASALITVASMPM